MKIVQLAVTLLMVASGVYAQADLASVMGTVTDAADAVVPGATVSIRNTETNLTRAMKLPPREITPLRISRPAPTN